MEGVDRLAIQRFTLTWINPALALVGIVVFDLSKITTEGVQHNALYAAGLLTNCNYFCHLKDKNTYCLSTVRRSRHATR